MPGNVIPKMYSVRYCKSFSLAICLLLGIMIHGMRNKTFDCVQMKRHGAELVRKQLEGKTIEQQPKYWQKGTSELKKLQRQTKKGH
jgi:hypothetical protein